MFLFSLLTLTDFFFLNQAQRVFSQWTQTGKPTNDFSCFFNLKPPLQLGPSREDIFIWVEATFIIFTLWSIAVWLWNSFFFCQTEIENQSHRKFISHVSTLIFFKLSNVVSILSSLMLLKQYMWRYCTLQTTLFPPI